MTLYIDLNPHLQWAVGEDDIADEAVTPYGKYIIFKHDRKIVLRFEREKHRIVRLGTFAESEIEKARGIAQAHYESQKAKYFSKIELPDLWREGDYETDYEEGWNDCREALMNIIQTTIDSAKTKGTP